MIDRTNMELGENMLDCSIRHGITNIKDDDVRNAMSKYWDGEISWEEQIDMICNSFNKRILKAVINDIEK